MRGGRSLGAVCPVPRTHSGPFPSAPEALGHNRAARGPGGRGAADFESLPPSPLEEGLQRAGAAADCAHAPPPPPCRPPSPLQVHSPTEFKDLCAAHGDKPVVLMCKAASCRPCKVRRAALVRPCWRRRLLRVGLPLLPASTPPPLPRDNTTAAAAAAAAAAPAGPRPHALPSRPPCTHTLPLEPHPALQAFARKYARASEKYTDTAFVEVYGDETKDTRVGGWVARGGGAGAGAGSRLGSRGVAQ